MKESGGKEGPKGIDASAAARVIWNSARATSRAFHCPRNQATHTHTSYVRVRYQFETSLREPFRRAYSQREIIMYHATRPVYTDAFARLYNTRLKLSYTLPLPHRRAQIMTYKKLLEGFACNIFLRRYTLGIFDRYLRRHLIMHSTY